MNPETIGVTNRIVNSSLNPDKPYFRSLVAKVWLDNKIQVEIAHFSDYYQTEEEVPPAPDGLEARFRAAILQAIVELHDPEQGELPL